MLPIWPPCSASLPEPTSPPPTSMCNSLYMEGCVRSLLYFTVTIKLRKMSIWFYGSSIIVLPGWLVQLLLRPFASWTTRGEGNGYSTLSRGRIFTSQRRDWIFYSQNGQDIQSIEKEIDILLIEGTGYSDHREGTVHIIYPQKEQDIQIIEKGLDNLLIEGT